MLGASLSEVWGEDFKIKPKKNKKKKFKAKPLSPDEMESELLIQEKDKEPFINDKQRVEMLRDDRLNDNYYTTNPYVVTGRNPYGKIPSQIQDDPDYKEFMEFKSMKNRRRFIEEQERKHNPGEPQKISKPEDQLNELLLYVFTGFFLLILYDNVYRLGKDSY